MSAKTKYYAVKNGRKNGIYNSWEECLVQVNEFPNAIYKSFKSFDEAKAFLNNDLTKEVKQTSTKKLNKQIDEQIKKLKTNEAIAFVDGSYMEINEVKLVGFGIVILHNNQTTKLNGSVSDEALLEFRNVTGEIYATKNAVIWALNNGIKKLTIYYDYEGIRSWALGLWKTNNELTTSYAKFINKYKDEIELNFEKVLAHSGIIYNEMVDELAKSAIERNTTK